MSTTTTRQLRERRRRRIRGKVAGTAERPRLAVFRSNRTLTVQVIDDIAGVTLASAGSAEKDLKGSALYLLAWIDFDAKKYAEAAKGWKRLTDDHPKHALAADAAYQRGVALKEAGEHVQRKAGKAGK